MRTHFLIRRPESENISSEDPAQKWSLPTAGGSAKPQILASVSSSRPPTLLVKKSGSSPCLYEAVQRSGYSISSDRLALLRWVASLIRAIRYFSAAAAAGVFLVVIVTLVVSYTEALRRKEKQIGVLLAYGAPMTMLSEVFVGEVVLVWFVAALFAVPSHWLISKSVENLVSQGFEIKYAHQAAASSPWGLWAGILALSLGIAIGAVLWTIWQRIDPKRVAAILRSPE